MTSLTISPDGMLRGCDESGKRWRVQMAADPAIPAKDWIARDYVYLRVNGFEQFKILSNLWLNDWKYVESQKIVGGSINTSEAEAVCGMSIKLAWRVEGSKLIVEAEALPVTPGKPCNFCIEVSDFDQKNRPPEPTATGDFVRTSENWRVRFWLCRGVSPAGIVAGTLTWDWGPEAKPLFDGPVKEWRAFDYAEVPDIAPYLGATKGWGTNVCAGAIHNLSEEQVKAECARLKSMGFTTLRLAHFDSFGGSPITLPDGRKVSRTILEDQTGFRRWLRLWAGWLVLDGLHGFGGDAFKANVYIDDAKWQQYLAVRKCVIDCIVAEKAEAKIVGWCDINENTVESPWWSRFGLPDSQKELKAREVYLKLLNLSLPFVPQYRVPTQAWGAHPNTGLGPLSVAECIAGNNYMQKPGVIESSRSLEWYIDQHTHPDCDNVITEWGNATGREIMADAFLAPPLQALLCVEKNIRFCCDFAWTQNEEVWQGNVKPWEGRLQPARALAMLPAALMFSRQERGYTRADGTLRIDTGKTHGMVGRLTRTSRIVPDFATGIVLTQELGAGTRLVTVLGRGKGGTMKDLQLERCSATVDGVTYSEGVHLVSR